MTRVSLNEKRHTYALDGKHVPGVTTIIKNATSSGGLISWAAETVAQWAATNVGALDMLGPEPWIQVAKKEPERIRDERGLQGRQVHEHAERLILGKDVLDVDADGNPYPDDVMAMAEQLARWMDAWDVQPVVHECVVFHEDDLWAGKLDAVADLADGQRWLLDYKTGQSGPWTNDALQLAAYRHASHIQIGDRDMLMAPVDQCGVVWIRPDFVELRPVLADRRMYDTFRTMRSLYPFSRVKVDELIYPPIQPPGTGAAA